MTGWQLVFAAWDEAFPDRKQWVLQPAEPMDHPFVEIARFECRIPGADFTENDDRALDSFAKPFAEKLIVSPIAMCIRLEKLGLLHHMVPLQCFCATTDGGPCRARGRDDFGAHCNVL